MSESTRLLTPYKCAAVVNKWLEEDGVQKKLPPQMFYQYTSAKKAYIQVTLNEEGKRCVDTDDLRTWYVEKYMKVKKVVESEVDENQLELDFESDES